MKDLINQILIGFCYGFCAMLLIRGTFIKPQILSHGLSVVVAGFAVVKVKQKLPHMWTVLGLAIGIVAGFVIPV